MSNCSGILTTTLYYVNLKLTTNSDVIAHKPLTEIVLLLLLILILHFFTAFVEQNTFLKV